MLPTFKRFGMQFLNSVSDELNLSRSLYTHFSSSLSLLLNKKKSLLWWIFNQQKQHSLSPIFFFLLLLFSLSIFQKITDGMTSIRVEIQIKQVRCEEFVVNISELTRKLLLIHLKSFYLYFPEGVEKK